MDTLLTFKLTTCNLNEYRDYLIYNQGDIVIYQGVSFRSLINNNKTSPINSPYYEKA